MTKPDGVAMTIGVFDGVHRGHVDLISRMVAFARDASLTPVCVTFDPDPSLVLRPEAEEPALTSLEERCDLVREAGISEIDVVPFTLATAQQSPEEFVDGLGNRHHLKSLWIGKGFALGRERSGTVTQLDGLGRDRGFDVRSVDLLLYDGSPISASWIRDLLRRGDVERASVLLGRPYSVAGSVIPGMQRGRELGFPTANVAPPEGRALPADGVYFVQIDLVDDPDSTDAFGVVNLGPRPTFDEQERLIETHLLDFQGDLYGKRMVVSFLRQVRPIQKFAGVDELRAQIGRDVEQARTWARTWPR